MDQQRFDAVTRTIARTPSRRKLLGLLVAGVASALLPGRSGGAQSDDVGFCPPGYRSCGGFCVDLGSDRDHCGACFTPCESGLVAVDCVAGECVRVQCATPLTYCGVVAGCVDFWSDPFNCGGCGIACDSGICAGGVCVPGPASCPPWLTECGGLCVDLASDLDHCGGCFVTCESGLVPVACRNGQCGRDQCGPDRTYCGIVGGCVDTSTDPFNCGGCDIFCPAGTSCWFGTCL